MPVFIETQFPIARISAESNRERKANNGQTLTRLGKWWGRKPLILVRAVILGMLMPASDDPRKDREIFLKILTMDDDGTWERRARDGRRQSIPARAQFDALPYAERIQLCERPENVAGPSTEAWVEINAHLGTTANSLQHLIAQLGERSFGRIPRVGDSFCGGGSIPFEAARMGCDALGFDLNPVASLLTWAGLNLLGGGASEQESVMRVQSEVLAAADRQIVDWCIEHNASGERADAFLYCVEVRPEGCEYFIPLAPGWVVGEKSRVVARWRRVPGSDRLQPDISMVTDAELQQYKDKHGATIVDGRVVDPFDPTRSWSVEALRGPDGLRRWTRDDVAPRSGDVFQERLYCIRWVKTVDENGRPREVRRYAAPDAADLAREARVTELLRERFDGWQEAGLIPSRPIPQNGAETERLFRERGWTHWHHLFTPRQLLTHGLLAEFSAQFAQTKAERAACLLGLGRVADWDARLSAWMPHKGNEKGNQVFYNQALNTHFSYSTRPLQKLKDTFCVLSEVRVDARRSQATVRSVDARDISEECDLWVTDPPYADAVNYHELGDFFLSWYEKPLRQAFPEFIADARAELAVRGDGDAFRRAMVDIYRNLARRTSANGLQLVMFTHQDPAVWAGLGMILWAAGLEATAAWTISTETEAAGIRKGNYVQGTVCLVLRGRVGNEPGFIDEVYPLVEDEVKRQIASMQALDEDGEPNFNDADYQLAAYAAALKVLTRYGTLDGKGVEQEVFAKRARDQKSEFQMVIQRALEIACDTLIPRGLAASWRELSLVERYYLRALDIESRGERRKGMYEELARGFGVVDIRPLLKSDKTGGTRMSTPSGLGASVLGPVGSGEAMEAARLRRAGPHAFAASALRHLMFAIRETTTGRNDPERGRQYLRDTFGHDYWARRERFIVLLEWLAALGNAAGMHEWGADSVAARLLAGRLRNDYA